MRYTAVHAHITTKLQVTMKVSNTKSHGNIPWQAKTTELLTMTTQNELIKGTTCQKLYH